ncbi:cAMP phosphodiesterase class-II:Metallo-beta-lactamase superfamily [gamma proteobacterium HTCC5015]|nr:cAMP phosphodiesterase class-II:Metallo-beta-lactamase superfamily [gamma proteobacterium HTCC5015]
MKLRVLGCSGGIASELDTTSYLLDEDVLIDAGTGLTTLSIEEIKRIRHIFLTHSHLDHIAGFPLMVDTLFGHQVEPLQVHAHPETIEALKEHIFNWVIWPNFEELEFQGVSAFEWCPMEHGERVQVGARELEMIPVNHTVHGVAYRVVQGEKSFCFSGDTTTNDSLWQTLNQGAPLDMLIVECGFSDSAMEVAKLSKHYTPTLLAEDLKKLSHKPPIGITHLKPGEELEIVRDLRAALPDYEVIHLRGGDIFRW